jgi:PAS domain S-box-containing protein
MLASHFDSTTRSAATVAFVDDLVDYAIIVLDTSGRVMTWNAGAEEFLGYKSDEVVGRRLSDFCKNLDVLALTADVVLDDAVTWGRYETTSRLVHKKGQLLEAHIILRPVRDDACALRGYGIVVRRLNTALHLPAGDAGTDRANIVALTRRARILVVDDDDLVLGVAVEQLSSLGYEIETATSGTEALAIIAHDGGIDILFTDVVMHNGLSGAALAEQVRQMRPELPILFASGYLPEALKSSGQLPAGAGCIIKPYRREDLARKVEGMLASRAPR